MRAGLGVLLALNVLIGVLAFFPPGGSLESVESDLITARKTLAARQQLAGRLKQNLAQVRQARAQTEEFMNSRFFERQAAYSMMEIALGEATKASGLQARDRTYGYEPVEGSDALGMAVINANFEGTYADLIEAVHALDRSTRLVILDQLQAQPQQGTGLLAINLKLYAFLREGSGDTGEEPDSSQQAMAAPGGNR
jgi:hypothetical protein